MRERLLGRASKALASSSTDAASVTGRFRRGEGMCVMKGSRPVERRVFCATAASFGTR
jgi:hypothetical protein